MIDRDPDQLVWILLARESTDRGAQVDHQFADLRAFVAKCGGRVDREVPENAVSAFKRQRVRLPDDTVGYRVVRPEWESILTALRRGECNALAVSDIDRAMRDPRTLEDLIDVVELYGVYVASRTGNIDLATDAGISAARGLVNQRNQESRNTSRRVMDGMRHAAMQGKSHGGALRPFGWRKDRMRLNKREAALLRREVPRIIGGVSPLRLAREWNDRGLRTPSGARWRSTTLRRIFLAPRIRGWVIYRDEVLLDEEGHPVRGRWEPILTEQEYEAVVAAWRPAEQQTGSRLGGKGRGYRTRYLLSPFLRCGVCTARMIGAIRDENGTKKEIYRCPAKGNGGCGSNSRLATPINEYIKALVIAEQQKIQFRKLDELPPWAKTRELAELRQRIEESTRRYEAGQYSPGRYFSSLTRMEAAEAELLREKRRYDQRQQTRQHAVTNLAGEWDKPDFTIEQKQTAIAQSLTAIIIKPAGKGRRFHPDQIVPVFNDDTPE